MKLAPILSAPPPPAPARTARLEAEQLLAGPVVRRLLAFLGGHAVILDADGFLLAPSEGALAALDLPEPFPAQNRFPAPAALDLPARNLCFAAEPVALDGGPARICFFKDRRARARGGPQPAPASRRRSGATAKAPAAAQAQAPPDPRDTVLVVDDSPVVRRLLEFLLDREGYRVLASGHGKEGLTLAFEHLPDLILLDAMMPGLSGFEVCRRLKADPRTREIPVLFVTILRGEQDEVAALEAGAIDFIPKPINPACLLARVRNHLELKHSKDRLRTLSLLDGLTGIANRRQFDQCLEAEWQRAARDGRPLSLIMGDVDFFKDYNDHFGHAQGDQCLREVAQVFQRALRRPGDLAARFGGEEFVCILPDTDEAGARAVADQILAAMEAMAMAHPTSGLGRHVTLSLGVATERPASAGGQAALIAAADRTLYEAKRSGRNRIVQADRIAARKRGPHQR